MDTRYARRIVAAPTTPPNEQPPASARWIPCVFLFALLYSASPWSRAEFALLLGIALALLGLTAWPKQSKTTSKWLIQGCVVLLGFRLDLGKLAESAQDGFFLGVGTIVGAIVLGLFLGKLLRTSREISTLITSGTAICGGSAIVAIGTSIGASTSNMAVATGAIFVLNAFGLWTLPSIGHSLGLSEVEFGQWAGIALHDIASVGGASKEYGAVAFETATIVKLTRVIWITPLAILAGRFAASGIQSSNRSPFPWFILCFLAASGVRTLVPSMESFESEIAQVSGVGFRAALFLIGSGLTMQALREVGLRAITQATLLWVLVAGGSLFAIRML